MKTGRWILGVLGGLMACQNLRQEVEPQQVADQPVKLIVACFISPQDTVLAAKVARSRPVLDDETVINLEITNATVSLQTGSGRVVLRYHNRLRYYRASPDEFPIRAGETYQLTVQTPDGQRVEARTTVPAAVELQRVELDSAVVLENEGRRKRFFTRFFWTDPPTESDYYQAEGIFRYRCPTCTTETSVRKAVQFVSAEGARAFYTDQQQNGVAMLSGPGYIGPPLATDQFFFSAAFKKPFVLTASLLHLNSDFYRYHRALEQQRQTDSNPFAEPVPIPTNISGGLGCFGAYSRSILEVKE
ncbi:hypothetical protein GCM10027299_19980 [Larkinella ripae]